MMNWNFNFCEYCGEVFNTDDLFLDENGKFICQSCLEKREGK
ncbi:hypothetical protein HMPREF0528_1515 [Lactobacillus johnsonii ATCC 33200]|uniref:Uncharacterized protein n=1 Tax=Lactobacillus johnsonii ATCC 33200 TaxID=525330 RepID=C2E6Z1_LACJH|nr:hypothetical protein HMPREF0528_1515 [Lactobacillus johnsonii ATCC 33200]